MTHKTKKESFEPVIKMPLIYGEVLFVDEHVLQEKIRKANKAHERSVRFHKRFNVPT